MKTVKEAGDDAQGMSVSAIKRNLRSMLLPARRLAARFVRPPSSGEAPLVGRHGCLSAAASFIAWNQIDGDYLEFGVFEGESFAAAYHSIHHHRSVVASQGIDSPELRRWCEARSRFFAFDSFEGLPPDGADRHADYFPGAYHCSESRFLANVEESGVDPRDIVTVKGFYDRTLTPEARDRLGLRRAALVLVDCDLYESTVPVLDFLTDLVGQGTILVFDDWFRYRGSPARGEQRACREWLAKNPHIELIEFWREGPQAVSFLVNLEPGIPTPRLTVR